MRNSPGERPVLPSVLDRLIDDQRELREDPPLSRAQSIRELKVSLQRDLEWLLNTRRIVRDTPESVGHLGNSLYVYGLPEFRELDVRAAAGGLARQMELAIQTFEPRLANIKVTMRPREGVERVAHFIIEAVLLIRPLPERVTFDTVLELTNGEYRVGTDRRA